MSSIKILHTADLHIGMKFSRYPDLVREQLVHARIDVLADLVSTGNKEQCHLLIIAGDLFDHPRISKEILKQTARHLANFTGDYVLILPGNHDYDDGSNDLWKSLEKNLSDQCIILNEHRVYELGLTNTTVAVYPAFCHQRHSAQNNLEWIKSQPAISTDVLKIGIAHGALEGLSADIEGVYFPMSKSELQAIPLDLWLLGHSHVRFPDYEQINDNKIFNSGTPEPDGLNYNRAGNAWLIEIDANKQVKAHSMQTGRYRFYDFSYQVDRGEDLEKIKKEILDDFAANKVVRLTLQGSLEESYLPDKQALLQELEAGLFYLTYDDSRLRKKITRELLEKEFTHHSFPHRFLSRLTDDEEALQIAYEMIEEVR